MSERVEHGGIGNPGAALSALNYLDRPRAAVPRISHTMKAQLKNTPATPALSKEDVQKLVSAAVKATLQAELNSGNYEFEITIEDKDVSPLPVIAGFTKRIAELEKALAAKPAAASRFDAVKEGGAK